MAEHKVQLPDNSVVTIEGPEDATDQELIDAAAQHYAKKQAENYGPISAVASGVDKAKKMDAMTYGLGTAGIAGLAALGLGKSLKDRFFGPDKSATNAQPQIEPQMDVNQQRPSEPYLEPETNTVKPTDWESSLSQEDRQLLERSRANAAAKATQTGPTAEPSMAPNISAGESSFAPNISAGEPTLAPVAEPVAPPVAAPVAAPAAVAPELPVPTNPKVPALLQPPTGSIVPPATAEPVPSPVLPTTPIKAEVAPVEAAPAPAATPEKRVEAIKSLEPTPEKATNDKVLETLKEQQESAKNAKQVLGEPDLTTGSGMPAYQGQGEEGGKVVHKKGAINSLKDIPQNMVFVPGGQNMDIVRNAVGQPEYTKNLKSAGGYPESPQAAYETSRNINKSLGRSSMAEAKASGVPLPEPTQSITQKIAGSKTVKLGGVTGALILATDLASAATTGESPLANMTKGFTEAVKNKDYGLAASHAAELLNFHPYTLLANQLFGNSPEELQILRQADQARKANVQPSSQRK